MVKASWMREWLKETLLQYIPIRSKSPRSISHTDTVNETNDGEFVMDFMFAREGYSVHTIASHVTDEAVFFICGSRVGGLKVINGLTGQPIVENVFITSMDLTMVYEGEDAYLFSCGRESSIPCWSISAVGRSKYLSSLFRHSDIVTTLDSICVTSYQRNLVVSKTNYLASGSFDQNIILWRLENHKWVVKSSFQKHSYNICKLKFFMMDREVMVASTDQAGNLLVWNIEDQSVIFSYKLHGPIHGVYTSNQTQNHSAIVAVVDAVGMVNVFDMRRMKLLYAHHNNCYQEFIRSVTIYDQGDERMLIGGCDDGVIYFWSLSQGELLHRVRAHRSWVNALHITDGSTPLLLSGGCDSRVSVWNIKRIICNIKYSRRKDYLMFLVGCGFQALRRGEECKDDADYSDVCDDYAKMSLIKEKKYMTTVFSSRDLCAMIARFI